MRMVSVALLSRYTALLDGHIWHSVLSSTIKLRSPPGRNSYPALLRPY